MERSVGPGGVLKKKNSSGCLIIKKKGNFHNSNNSSVGHNSNNKEKKRAKLAVGSVSGSSDDNESLEFMKRKAIVDKKSRNEVGDGGYCRESGDERKRSRLDLYDFDEYDEFDREKMRNEYMEDRVRMVENKEVGGGSSSKNVGVEKRMKAYFDGSSSGRTKEGYEKEDDEAHLPISLLKSKCQDKTKQPIRLQGKNGVLKVMVNTKTKIDSSSQHKNANPKEVEESRVSAPKPVYQGLRQPEKLGVLVRKNKNVEKEKRETELETQQPASSKGHRGRDLKIEGADTVLRLAPDSLEGSRTRKVVKEEVERSPVPETAQKGVREFKPKQGGSTEKQMLREQIREMLVNAGWTIDYRPRRNRDYLDAVYINTSGTAYWSIIKAYDAYKKQLEEDGGQSKQELSSPSPLPDSLIHKLTRRTRKKIEEEAKRKRKEAGLMKSGKAVTNASDDSDSDEDGDRKVKKIKSEKIQVPPTPNVLQGRTSKIIGRCTLLVRGSDKGKELEPDGYVPYTGKRTILGWLIDSGMVHLSEKLQYMNRKRTRVMLEGWITRDGIHCGCCSKILTVSKFELHAGSKLRQPFQNIFLESGASLLQCQIDAWNKQEETVRRDFHVVNSVGDDPDDDTCGICGDGGDLICCDSCPSTFHQTCLEIKMLPSGDWHCSNCKCKFCGNAEQLIQCSICKIKYHKSCSEKESAQPFTSNAASFCGLKCQELYDHLQKMLGVKHELEAGFSWSIIHRTDVSDASQHSYHQRVESNSKLAVALSVMDECFMPIFDRRSGINMINSVVYNCGSNFNRLDYRGFYTVILERGDEIISAACVRIHGTRLAEMPFIGTRDIYRRQGMCRRLLSAVEMVLSSLKIGHLIIPAIPEHMNTWTVVFGFRELENELKKDITSMNMLVFPGTDMLQKPLVQQACAVSLKVSESVKDDLNCDKKSDVDSSTVNRQVSESDDSEMCNQTKTHDESDDVKVANPSVSVCQSDLSLHEKKTAVEKSKMENNEIQLLKPAANDDASYPVETSVDNAQKIKYSSKSDEAPDAFEDSGNAKKASVLDNVDSLMKVPEDAKLIENNGPVDTLSGTVSETSAQNIISDKVNVESMEPLSETSVQLMPEPNILIEIDSSVEPSLDSDGASVTKENGEVSTVQLSSDSSLVKLSENEKVQILNENKCLAPVSGSEEVQVNDQLLGNQSPTDNLDEEIQLPSGKPKKEILLLSDQPCEEIQFPSDRVDEELSSDKPGEETQMPSDKPNEAIELLCDQQDEEIQLSLDKHHEEIQLSSDKLEEIQLPSDKPQEEIQVSYDKPDEEAQLTSEKANEIQLLSSKADEEIQVFSIKVGEETQLLSNKIDEETQLPSDKPSEEFKLPSDIFDEEIQLPSDIPSEEIQLPCDKVDEEIQLPSDKIDEEAQSLSDKPSEEIQLLSDKVVEEIQLPSDIVDEEVQLPFNNVNEEIQLPSDKPDEEIQLPFGKPDEEIQLPSDILNEEIQLPSNRIDEKIQLPSDQLDEELQLPSDKIEEGQLPSHRTDEEIEIQLPSDKLNEEIQLPSNRTDEEIQVPSDQLNEKLQLPSDKLNEEIQLPSNRTDEEIQVPSDQLNEKLQLASDRIEEEGKLPSDRPDEEIEIQLPSDKLNEDIQLPPSRTDEEIQVPSDQLDEELLLPSGRIEEKVQLPSDKTDKEIQLPSVKCDEDIKLPSADEEIQLPSDRTDEEIEIQLPSDKLNEEIQLPSSRTDEEIQVPSDQLDEEIQLPSDKTDEGNQLPSVKCDEDIIKLPSANEEIQMPSDITNEENQLCSAFDKEVVSPMAISEDHADV